METPELFKAFLQYLDKTNTTITVLSNKIPVQPIKASPSDNLNKILYHYIAYAQLQDRISMKDNSLLFKFETTAIIKQRDTINKEYTIATNWIVLILILLPFALIAFETYRVVIIVLALLVGGGYVYMNSARDEVIREVKEKKKYYVKINFETGQIATSSGRFRLKDLSNNSVIKGKENLCLLKFKNGRYLQLTNYRHDKDLEDLKWIVGKAKEHHEKYHRN